MDQVHRSKRPEDSEVRAVLAKLQSQTLNNLAQSYARLGDRKRAQQSAGFTMATLAPGAMRNVAVLNCTDSVL